MRLNWYKMSPEGYKAMLGLQKIVDESKIDHRLLELIKIRASQINGCAHCLEMHTKDSLALGENEQRIFYFLPGVKHLSTQNAKDPHSHGAKR
ncbi:MAG: carboxymuconolactone decarboxylase family protein [Ignavibacteriaceae bacterium]|nr:carboxymuconolactone decarboxylase family protein [Ignavibacteriaceae bacterium]